MQLAVFFIILSLILLMYLAYKGFSVIAVAPLLALMAVLLSSLVLGEDPHLMAHYTEKFMVSLGGYVKSYFPIFLLGAILGKMLEDSGSADAIAQFITKKIGSHNAILAVIVSCAILTYGGVSLFVVSFAMYPIGAKLFREAGISKRILPGTIALGAFTFTMTAMPGTPQIQNAIPMKFFGTDVYAAPVLGIVASVIMFGGGLFWLKRRARHFAKIEPGYGNWKENLASLDQSKETDLPSIFVAVAPILVALIVNLILAKVVFIDMDGSYLADFNTEKSAVVGNWSLIIALVCSILTTIILNYKRFNNIVGSINNGVAGSFLAIFNTASETGYGNVIAALSAFTIIAAAITSVSHNPLVLTAVSSSVLAGVTGSASGGLSIALTTMGDQLLEISKAAGINPEVLHRVAAVACGGMDTLPHNGAVITLLGITQMTHKDSYLDICVNTVVIPLIACAVIVILGTLGVC